MLIAAIFSLVILTSAVSANYPAFLPPRPGFVAANPGFPGDGSNNIMINPKHAPGVGGSLFIHQSPPNRFHYGSEGAFASAGFQRFGSGPVVIPAPIVQEPIVETEVFQQANVVRLPQQAPPQFRQQAVPVIKYVPGKKVHEHGLPPGVTLFKPPRSAGGRDSHERGGGFFGFGGHHGGPHVPGLDAHINIPPIDMHMHLGGNGHHHHNRFHPKRHGAVLYCGGNSHFIGQNPEFLSCCGTLTYKWANEKCVNGAIVALGPGESGRFVPPPVVFWDEPQPIDNDASSAENN